MSKVAPKLLVLVFLMALMSLAIVSTASAAVCPGGPGPTCIELRVENPPNPNNTPTFTDGATVQTWPTPGVPGCLPDVTPNWPGALVAVDATAPVAPPIQTCYNNFSLWVRSGRDVGSMAGSQCINDLENVAFDSPAGKLFTSVSIELKCLGPATRLHDVQVYYYISPGVLCEQQLIEPPLYAAKPHGAPGVNSYILDTVPSDTLCAAGFRRIEIEPQIGSACSVVKTNDFRTASVPLSPDVLAELPDVTPNWTRPSFQGNTTAPNSPAVLDCNAPDAVAPQLIVIKHVINDNGGTAVAADFTLDSGGVNDTPDDFPGTAAPGTTVTLDAGAYNVTETGPAGYTATFSAGCTGTIADGETKTCTVTNDDQAGSLIVIKHVINDDGGTAVAADFTLDSGGANDTPDNFPGAEAPGTTVTLDAGAYNVTETGPTGYTATYSADCTGAIVNGQTRTCTVTNDDIALGCTLSQGYWKTHSYHGPAPADPGWYLIGDVDGDGVSEGPDEAFFASGQTWYQTFKTNPKGGNAYYILAYQYMAAVLNVANGANPTALGTTLADAEALLAFYSPGRSIPKSSPDRALAIMLAGTLDSFNNGVFPGGPPHCTVPSAAE